MVNGGDMGGRRPGEKLSSFSVTCSRLSQYLKENGGFGELSLGMAAAAAAAARPPVDGRGKPETLRTMNLLPGVEALEADEHPAASQDGASDRTMKCPAPSMELFPQSAGFAPAHTDKKPDLNMEPRAAAAQMTIFYGGKVVVFDNFPAEKARELMTMAGRGCPPPSQHAAASATVLATTSDSKPGATAAAVPAAVTQEEQQKQTQPASTDLPIARRVSLHRFLEKRKDRINSKAPYQLNAPASGGCAPSSASPAKPEEAARQWLGLAPQTSKPEDLNR